MYKAIVVDDEPWIVEGIKAEVRWNDFGFEVVGAAEDGLEALKLIERLRPEVVLTDIKMPVMNGLELIRQGKTLSPDTQFVVLSGHAEFAYAQKAMQYGTFGYCLKPFEIEEIHGMLGRLTQFFRSNPHAVSSPDANHSDLYDAICTGDGVVLNRLLAASGLPLSNETRVVPIVVQGMERAITEPNMPSFHMNRRKYGYLVPQRAKDRFLHALISAEHSGIYGIGVGQPASDAASLIAALEAASLSAYGPFATGIAGVYEAAAAPSGTPVEEKLQEISRSIQAKDRIGFASAMTDAKTGFLQGTYTIRDAHLLYTSVLYLIPREGARAGGRFFESYEQLSTWYGSAVAMIDDLVRMTLESFSAENEADVSGITNKKIREIALYIRDRFHQELSIQTLAERFYLSPNYMCQLFKKETGETIMEHISRLRIDHACKLLRETLLPISQVGEKSGFQDYFYFTRIFKRYMSMTPTQYREQS